MLNQSYLKTSLFMLALLGSLTVPASLDARVGDTKSELERRLFDAGGIAYRNNEIRQARMDGMPYNNILSHLPGSVEVRVYFKTASGRRAVQSELNARNMPAGWELHVVYVNDRSVLEVYRRSQRMTEQERNELLAIQSGNSYWERIEDPEDSALNFTKQLADGRLRAREGGGNGTMLLIFDANMDRVMNQVIRENRAQSAPVSINGF